MLEDLRNHDPSPTDDERAWMASNPLSVLVHVAALAGLAVAIGLSASQLLDANPRQATVASTTR